MRLFLKKGKNFYPVLSEEENGALID